MSRVLELRIAGPGLDVVRRVEAGEPDLVLGRDPDCGVCLPDPHRNVSRRHLALWLDDRELRFRVLSVVNGVSVNAIEIGPGGEGVLPEAETLRLGEYTLCPVAAPVEVARTDLAEADPWAALAREASGIQPTAGPREDDPFGDWGFESTFGPGAPGGALDAASLQEGNLSSFFAGLGISPESVGALTHGELEAMGRTVRLLVERTLALHADVMEVRNVVHAEDRTRLAPPETNPLAVPGTLEARIRYLFGGRAAAAGRLAPEQAVRSLMNELQKETSRERDT